MTAKLSFLEELSKTKSPVEEAYKDWWGDYPSGTSSNASQWVTFQAGYNAAYEEKVSEEPEENEWKLVALRLGEKLSDNGPGGYYDFTPGEWFEWALNECKKEEPEEQKWDVVRESLKWCKEHPNESVEDYLTPKTPEKRKIDDLAEKLLPDDHPYKIADEHGETNPYKQYLNSVEDEKKMEKLGFVKSSDGNWTARPLDWVKPQTPEEIEKGLRDAMRQAKKDGVFDEKSPFDIIEEWAEKNKRPSLYEILMDWWTNDDWTDQTDESIIDNLVDIIDDQFIPHHHNTNDYQWNKCLKLMRDKLR